MMKFHSYIVIGLSLMAGAIQAQERAAASGMDVQMTWSALSTQISAVNVKTDAVNTRVDQAVICGRKGMVYAPGASGADAGGCLVAAVPVSVTNAITNLTNLLNTTNGSVTNISNCGDAGKIFDKSSNKCVNGDMTVQNLGSTGTYTMSTGRDQSGSSPTYGIPSGTSVIVANMLCKVVGSKAAVDSTIVFNNAGGYPANKLCYLAGVSKDNTATTMDTKYVPVPQGATAFRIDYSATQVQNTSVVQATMTFMGHN